MSYSIMSNYPDEIGSVQQNSGFYFTEIDEAAFDAIRSVAMEYLTDSSLKFQELIGEISNAAFQFRVSVIERGDHTIFSSRASQNDFEIRNYRRILLDEYDILKGRVDDHTPVGYYI